MVTVDKFFGTQTVKSDTLQSLKDFQQRKIVVKYSNLQDMKKEDIVYCYVWGYWITRFLMDMCPGLLQEVLKKKQKPHTIDKMIASALGISSKTFWDEVNHYSKVEGYYAEADLGLDC